MPDNNLAMYGDLGRPSEPTESEVKEKQDQYWLDKARKCHRSSTDFLDINYRRQWEKNLAHFNGEHARDSKFNSSNYKNRNSLFRPKTRAISLHGESAFSKAMFSTADLTSIKAEDSNDPLQLISAEINQELLQYRLKKTIPWFLTAMGAWQDTFNYGICISYQYWKFETRKKKVAVPGVLDEYGEQAYDDVIEIIKDEPCVDLIKPENFRFDMSADWRDVVGTSPFLERLEAFKLDEVMAKMEQVDSKTGTAVWRKHSKEQILSAAKGFNEDDSTRRAREGKNRQDPFENRQVSEDFENIWCREYIVRDEGTDYVYWTIGESLMLTDPVPIEEVYFHGRRPFEVGISTIESHKAIPASKNEMVSSIQESINKLTNQRFDNVDLVLNKRYFLRRGQNIDTPALMRNVPGGGVYMDDPATDVKIVTTPDVTSSSYEEQNRLSNEMDEVGGNFSPSSIQSNRELNETVGGMQLNRASSDELTEYSILIFVHTWVEPVLRQLLALEQAYESDEVVLALAAGKSDMYQRLNLGGNVPEQLLMQELKLSVDVGIGNTDPTQKGDKFTKAISTVLQVVPGAAARLNGDAAIKEILGGAGRKDGDRFFNPEEEQPQQQGETDPVMAKAQADAQAAQEIKKYEIDAKLAFDREELQLRDRQFYAKLATDKDVKLEQLYGNLGIQGSKLQQAKETTALVEGNKKNELLFKATTGRQGI
jgi:hypothetical protein